MPRYFSGPSGGAQVRAASPISSSAAGRIAAAAHVHLAFRAYSRRSVFWGGAFIPVVYSTVNRLMTTNKVDVAAPSTVTAPPPPAAPQGSLVRLLVLLGMLALVVGAYAYDFLVARPRLRSRR